MKLPYTNPAVRQADSLMRHVLVHQVRTKSASKSSNEAIEIRCSSGFKALFHQQIVVGRDDLDWSVVLIEAEPLAKSLMVSDVNRGCSDDLGDGCADCAVERSGCSRRKTADGLIGVAESLRN